MAVGGITALSVATGGTVGAAIAGSAVVASAVGTAAAGTIGVMSGAVVTSVSRNALGIAVLGENNTAEKFVNDALTSAAISGTVSVAGYGISAAYNYWNSNQTSTSISENANWINPDGTGGRLGQEMSGATANSDVGGCDKAIVNYGDVSNSKLLPSAPLPPNNGAIHGTEKNIYLEPGIIIDRYGENTGCYFAPDGTPVTMRALRPNTNLNDYHRFEVLKPFEVESSIIAPYYGQMGMGTQYHSTYTAEDLIKNGIIREIVGE